MTIAEAVTAVQNKLNRPQDDDKFPVDPVIYRALTESARKLRREVALFEPELIDFEEIVPPDDSTGVTYTLASAPQGGLRLFTPPGFYRGSEILPADYGDTQGYVLSGDEVRLLVPRIYSPGLYCKYVAPLSALDGNSTLDDVLPEPMHTALYLAAAARLARTPGSRINAQELENEFRDEWGDVKRQRKMVGPAIWPSDSVATPWWRLIR